eukprot:UN20534
MAIAKTGADINVRSKLGETAAYISASNGEIECLQYLLDRDADLSISSNHSGLTPCLTASYKKHWKCVELIAQKNGDVTSSSSGSLGWTPIMYSALYGRVDD